MGEYSRGADIWILWTWNDEIQWIIELPVGFSVANAGAGAKNGIFGESYKVLCSKEWCYGIPTLIDVRDDRSDRYSFQNLAPNFEIPNLASA